MLYDELYKKLKDLTPDINLIEHFWQTSLYEQKLKQLQNTIKEENFWNNPKLTEITTEFQRLKQLQEDFTEIMILYKDNSEILNLFKYEEQALSECTEQIHTLEKKINHYKINLLLNKPQDESNCFVSINAGAGGTEAQDWAIMVLRMYMRFCQEAGLHCSTIDYQDGEAAGIKSATLFIKGKHAYGLLKTEHGIHRLVRISPFDANKKRHTSFCSVTVIPEIPELQFTIDPADLRIDTYRASGAGGQHVNKTESAVRITHIPTNIVVQCQIERSQIQNRETAMKMLRAKLAQKYQSEQETSLIGGIEKKKNEWGSQIRSYILHPYKMVKDHRTELESMQPEKVLDGELMPFIEKTLLYLHESTN